MAPARATYGAASALPSPSLARQDGDDGSVLVDNADDRQSPLAWVVRISMMLGVAAMVGFAASGGPVAASLGRSGAGAGGGLSARDAAAARWAGGLPTLSFSVSNEYVEREGHPGAGYPFLEFGYVVEPGRPTTLTASASPASHMDALAGCSWRVAGASSTGGGMLDAALASSADADVRPAHTAARGFSAQASSVGGASDAARFELTFPAPGTYLVELACGFSASEADGDINNEGDRPAGGDGAAAAAARTVATASGATLPAPWYSYSSDSVTHARNVSCYYVRRELRDLTDTDRDGFLAAIEVTLSVGTDKGREMYGLHYKSMVEYELEHLTSSGARRVDHFHDGMGLATQHIAMSSEFELTLQAVDAAIALPYWDYTRDAVWVHRTYGGPEYARIFSDGVLFHSDWFGRTDTLEHTVTEGRWAYQELPKSYNYSTHSAYGYLRAPWNLNPGKYVTRYHTMCGQSPDAVAEISTITNYHWPTCEMHYKLTFDYASWYDWSWAIGYIPHGPVHVWVGGTGGGCDEYGKLEPLVGNTTVELMKAASFGMLKNLWRDELLETPKYCSSDAQSECKFKCKRTGRADAKFNKKVVTLLGGYMVELDGYSPNQLADIMDVLYCDTAFWPGDQLEAASPIEASFWPIHPTIDRLLQYKELALPFTSHDWSDLQPETLCSYFETSCRGHHAGDVTYWRTAARDATSGDYVQRYLTNEEVRTRVRPTNGSYGMPYVYNNFNWNHCETENVTFRTV